MEAATLQTWLMLWNKPRRKSSSQIGGKWHPMVTGPKMFRERPQFVYTVYIFLHRLSPEVFLKRPATDNYWRLDEILKRKAVLALIFKE